MAEVATHKRWWCTDRAAHVVVGAMCAAYAIVFSIWSLHKYDNFLARRFDLGNMVQAVSRVAHGDFLMTSTDVLGEQASRFAGHVEPILYLGGVLWHLWPDPRVLLIAQAVVVSTAAIPAYLLARVWLRDARIGLVFAFVTLMSPWVQSQTLFDFHPVALATPFLLWAIWAAATNHVTTLWVMVILAISCKEHVGLAVAVFGIWIAWTLGRRVLGVAVSLVGLAWSAFAIGFLIPHFRTPSAESMLASRYAEFGDSVGEALVTLIVHPIRSLEILTTPGRIAFLLALLVPLLFLPLRAPLLAAGALPEIVIDLMSSRSEQHQVVFHYAAVAIPFLIAASIAGLRAIRLGRSHRLRGATRSPVIVVSALVSVTLISSWILSPLPGIGPPPFGGVAGSRDSRVSTVTRDDPRAGALRDATRQIPAAVVISAGNEVGGHLSDRRRILTFPVVDDAEWIIVDTVNAGMGDGRDPVAHSRRLRELRQTGEWSTVFDRDGVLVLRREEGE